MVRSNCLIAIFPCCNFCKSAICSVYRVEFCSCRFYRLIKYTFNNIKFIINLIICHTIGTEAWFTICKRLVVNNDHITCGEVESNKSRSIYTTINNESIILITYRCTTIKFLCIFKCKLRGEFQSI